MKKILGMLVLTLLVGVAGIVLVACGGKTINIELPNATVEGNNYAIEVASIDKDGKKYATVKKGDELSFYVNIAKGYDIESMIVKVGERTLTATKMELERAQYKTSEYAKGEKITVSGLAARERVRYDVGNATRDGETFDTTHYGLYDLYLIDGYSEQKLGNLADLYASTTARYVPVGENEYKIVGKQPYSYYASAVSPMINYYSWKQGTGRFSENINGVIPTGTAKEIRFSFEAYYDFDISFYIDEAYQSDYPEQFSYTYSLPLNSELLEFYLEDENGKYDDTGKFIIVLNEGRGAAVYEGLQIYINGQSYALSSPYFTPVDSNSSYNGKDTVEFAFASYPDPFVDPYTQETVECQFVVYASGLELSGYKKVALPQSDVIHWSSWTSGIDLTLPYFTEYNAATGETVLYFEEDSSFMAIVELDTKYHYDDAALKIADGLGLDAIELNTVMSVVENDKLKTSGNTSVRFTYKGKVGLRYRFILEVENFDVDFVLDIDGEVQKSATITFQFNDCVPVALKQIIEYSNSTDVAHTYKIVENNILEVDPGVEGVYLEVTLPSGSDYWYDEYSFNISAGLISKSDQSRVSGNNVIYEFWVGLDLAVMTEYTVTIEK